MSGKEHKMTQQQIDQLMNEDSDEDTIDNKKKKQANDDYNQDFQEQPIQEQDYAQEQQEIDDEEIIQQQNYSGLEGEPEVESQIQQENEQQSTVKKNNKMGSDFAFRKDKDLSEVKSQFIDSSRMDDGMFGKKAKSSHKNQSKLKQPVKNKQAYKRPVKSQKQTAVKPQTKLQSIKTSKPVSQGEGQSSEKKPKLSESQIKQRMKDIIDSKQEILRKKEEKKKKDEEIRKQQYEQAKKIEEERKQRNRKILEEQKAKKKVENNSQAKSQTKTPQQQIKIPEKRNDFTYMQQKKQRKQNEKTIQQKIEEENKIKLKKLKEARPQQLKGQARKAAFIEERKNQQARSQKQRQLEAKEGDTLVIKQIKQQINECRKFNLDKNVEINRADKTIADLNKKIKEKQKLLFSGQPDKEENVNQRQQINDFSELTPIQKFIRCFPEASNSDQIFRLIDVNGDGVLSCEQIMDKLAELDVDKAVSNKVYEILDQNSDGTVSHEEFVFLVDMQLKKQSNYRKIMGDIDIADPLDLEAKILDMQTKIKYINSQIQQHLQNNTSEVYQQKYDKLMKKVAKYQSEYKKETIDYNKKQTDKEGKPNFAANLANEVIKLRNQRKIRASFLQKLRTKVKDNLAEKSKLLASRAEQNLRLQQALYNIKNQIQERQLRFLSLKKVQANKKGYLDRQTVRRKQIEEAYNKAKEYQVSITDPTKKAQRKAESDELKFLAAVLMIQRNYRRRRAMRQLQRLKQEQSSSQVSKPSKK